jgi:hypothetical protein
MSRLRISLPLALLLLTPLAAQAQYNDLRAPVLEDVPGAAEAFNKEVTETNAEVMKYSDADGDGVLSYPESQNALTKVIDLMIDRLPNAGYISGGEVTIERMRQKIMRHVSDKNRDGKLDAHELESFVGFAIAERERTRRTPYDAQFRLTMDEARKKIHLSDFRREAALIKFANLKWQLRGEQQRKEFWYEVQARRRAMRAEADAEIAESRYETEQIWKARKEQKEKEQQAQQQQEQTQNEAEAPLLPPPQQ